MTHPQCTCENVAMWDAAKQSWVMWYRGGWGTQGVGFATSPDGVTWTKYAKNPVFGYPNDGGQPWVVRVQGSYWLYTTNNQNPPRVNIANSTDGLTWTLLKANISLPSIASLWGNRVVWIEEDEQVS